MGRCINYTITNALELSDQDKDKVFAISQEMNSGEFKDVWTCENFFLDPLAYYPNWENEKLKEQPHQKVGEIIDEHLKTLINTGLSRTQALKLMAENRMINFFNNNPNEIYNFTKVGGNEYNAFLVIYTCKCISEETEARISISDEGDFLLAPIIIYDGKAQLDLDHMQSDIDYWTSKLTDPNYKNYKEEFEEHIKEFNSLRHKYWNEFEEIKTFCRPINPDDFKNHPEYSAGQIMAGFNGEYWGRNKTDPETDSLKMCNTVKKALGNNPNYKIIIAQKIK